jgi:hypothetical protein
MSEKETVIKLSSPPIPKVQKVEENEPPQEEPEEILDIPEYDIKDFDQVSHEEIILTDEEQLERRNYLRKLFRYRESFPEAVKNLPISDGVNMTMTDLKNLVDDTEYLISCKQGSQSSKSMFLGGCRVAEVMSGATPLKLKGLTDVCENSDDLLSVVEELSIKYQSQQMITPEARFALIMSGLCLQIHRTNKGNETESIVPNEKQDDRSKKIDDLCEGL